MLMIDILLSSELPLLTTCVRRIVTTNFTSTATNVRQAAAGIHTQPSTLSPPLSTFNIQPSRLDGNLESAPAVHLV